MLGFACLSLSSCNSCTEEAASRYFDVYWDLDGDGDYGDRGGEYNPSFKGKVCSGSVGCDCSGFKPITGGDVWEEDYCKKCSHSKGSHKQ